MDQRVKLVTLGGAQSLGLLRRFVDFFFLYKKNPLTGAIGRQFLFFESEVMKMIWDWDSEVDDDWWH